VCHTVDVVVNGDVDVVLDGDGDVDLDDLLSVTIRRPPEP
jgi:hypothetical protein